jgi:neural Wiskott-Aldrich syndrome protein
VFSAPQNNQPAYENTHSTLQPPSFQQQQSRGPRYSLPNPPSAPGFVTSSGFVPLNQLKPDAALPGRTGPTPAPGTYSMTPSVISHHTGFVPIPTVTPAPSGFLPTASSLQFQPGYHNPQYPIPAMTPMPYGLPPLPMTIPPPPQPFPQQYSHSIPQNSPSPLQLTSSPIAERGNASHTPSPPQNAYSQLQGEQPALNPNSRPLPLPSMISRRRSTLPVPPGGGGITISPANSSSRLDNMYSGGNYQQPVQSIQYNNIPPPPPLPSRFNTAPPQIQSHISGQTSPLPPPLPQRPLIHSHSQSLPGPPQPWATNGQPGSPFPPVQQNSQHNLPVPPVQQNALPSPSATSPSRRLALPQPPNLPNPPTQQPIYVPPPPPLAPTVVSPYPNQFQQPPMQYSQGHHVPADGYPLQQHGALYQQPTGTVWNYH